MPSDLPDYTRLVIVNVDIPDVNVGPVKVGQYFSIPAVLSDEEWGSLLVDQYGRLAVVLDVDTSEDKVGPVNVARYQSAPGDIEDGARAPLLVDVKGRIVVVQHEKDRTITSGDINVRPKGGTKGRGSATTTAAYAEIASVAVTDGKQFQVSKIVVSAETAAWFKYQWNNTDISCERLMDDKTIVIEHFPLDYEEMIGDGTKKFAVLAKYDSSAGTINAEIVGEEQG